MSEDQGGEQGGEDHEDHVGHTSREIMVMKFKAITDLIGEADP